MEQLVLFSSLNTFIKMFQLTQFQEFRSFSAAKEKHIVRSWIDYLRIYHFTIRLDAIILQRSIYVISVQRETKASIVLIVISMHMDFNSLKIYKF